MRKLFPCQNRDTTVDDVISIDRSISPSRVNIKALSVQGYTVIFQEHWAPQLKEAGEQSRSKSLSQKIDCDRDQQHG